MIYGWFLNFCVRDQISIALHRFCTFDLFSLVKTLAYPIICVGKNSVIERQQQQQTVLATQKKLCLDDSEHVFHRFVTWFGTDIKKIAWKCKNI